MNKSFEIEYKKYADSIIPDLWDRIEAGVDKLEAANKENKVEKDTNEINKDNIADINERKENKKNKIINFMATHGVQVMAAVVSIFVIPGIVILAVRNSGNMSAPAAEAVYSDAPAAAADTAADYSMQESASAEEAEADYSMDESAVAEEAEADYSMEAPATEEAADYCNEEAAEVAIAAEAADEASGTEDAAGYANGAKKQGIQRFASKDSDMDDYAAAEEEEAEEAESSVADVNRLDNITAVINSRNEDGTYQITVVNDPNGRFAAHEKLTVAIQVKAEETYNALSKTVKTGSMVVSIIVDEDAENMYTIADVSTENEKK